MSIRTNGDSILGLRQKARAPGVGQVWGRCGPEPSSCILQPRTLLSLWCIPSSSTVTPQTRLLPEPVGVGGTVKALTPLRFWLSHQNT